MSGIDIAPRGICLCACSVMSGTDIACDFAVCLRACYAMSGTHLAYAATRQRAKDRCQPLSAYARAMRCPVLTERKLL
eukprot:3940808-Rhodomonas_salina.2